MVLGGGVGGQVVANELRWLLPHEHRIIVIERNLRHAFAPSFLWVMTGDRRPAQIIRDLRDLLHPGVEVIKGDVRAIDLANRHVTTQLAEVNPGGWEPDLRCAREPLMGDAFAEESHARGNDGETG